MRRSSAIKHAPIEGCHTLIRGSGALAEIDSPKSELPTTPTRLAAGQRLHFVAGVSPSTVIRYRPIQTYLNFSRFQGGDSPFSCQHARHTPRQYLCRSSLRDRLPEDCHSLANSKSSRREQARVSSDIKLC